MSCITSVDGITTLVVKGTGQLSSDVIDRLSVKPSIVITLIMPYHYQSYKCTEDHYDS